MKNIKKMWFAFLLAIHYKYQLSPLWFGASSYASKVPVTFTGNHKTTWHKIEQVIARFTMECDGEYTIGFDTEHRGILILYGSEYCENQFKGRTCGQSNVLSCMECGVCGHNGYMSRSWTGKKIVIRAGTSIDREASYPTWSEDALADRVRLIEKFDQACEEIRLVAQGIKVQKTHHPRVIPIFKIQEC